jgi:putative transposase
MRFTFIAKHRSTWQTRQLCEALGVSRAGFYEWLRRPESLRAQTDRQLLEQIRTSFEQSDRTYGSPRVLQDLRAWGYRCGRHRVARLMLAAGRRHRTYDVAQVESLKCSSMALSGAHWSE